MARTFTLNSYGVFGVDGSAAIINHPEVAMIGLGRIIDRPWVHEGALAIRQETQQALSFDHRNDDGALGSQVLADLARVLADPATTLAWS